MCYIHNEGKFFLSHWKTIVGEEWWYFEVFEDCVFVFWIITASENFEGQLDSGAVVDGLTCKKQTTSCSSSNGLTV